MRGSERKKIMSSHLHLLLVLISSLLIIAIPKSESSGVPVAPGLSFTFYSTKCPNLETIIRNQLQKVFQKDITQAAGLLRLHFHDCFVQGCDGSVLLDGSTSGPSEQNAPPNLSLRKQAFQIVNDLRALVQKSCGQVVSCADITALAARDSVLLTGGPNYKIPLGRRDGQTLATQSVTLANLPAPFSDASTILNALALKKFDTTDVVALSGGHTIGRSHCNSFTSRLYPKQDTTMDPGFANNLKASCPKSNTDNTVNLDFRSPNVFDNKYYVDLVNRQGLFTSDQDLFTNSKTKGIVTSFANNQSLFFDKFVNAMLKMGQLGVLTGTQGEIRANCSARNVKKVDLWSVVEYQEHKQVQQLSQL